MIYYIQKIVGYEVPSMTPIEAPILEHRGKNKGNIKYFKGVYSVNKYMQKFDLNSGNHHFIYVKK